ncbi:hypothetical protein D3C87_1176690 [compost metagenome]
MTFASQRDYTLFTITRQQAADLGHHHVPVAQQVETHHRDQHQIGQPADQRQTGGRCLTQHHADNVGGLTHVLADRGLDLIELPETVRQPQLRLRPRHSCVLQPVEHLRCQFVQTQQLLGEHRHQHQHQCGDDQREQRKHRDHAPGSRQPEFFQSIHQRIEQISQQQRHQKRREDRVQQPHKRAKQDYPTEPEPTPRIGHVPLLLLLYKERLTSETATTVLPGSGLAPRQVLRHQPLVVAPLPEPAPRPATPATSPATAAHASDRHCH